MANKLIRNHTKDNKVSFQWPAEGVDFYYRAKRSKNHGSLEFGEGIVRIGTNRKGKIKSFICPQPEVAFDVLIGGKQVKFQGLGEVEVDYVGGSIDPVTGKGKILLKGVEWRYWGEYTSGSENWSVAKEEAAVIPVRNPNGGPTLKAESKETPEEGSFVSFSLQGLQKKAKGVQAGIQQDKIIEVVKAARPGFTSGGTSLTWSINAHSPIRVVGDEYVDLAHALHMGITTTGQAL